MISNSSSPPLCPRSAIVRALGAEFRRTAFPCELIQYAVHHLGLLAIEEGVGEIDIFRDGDAAWNILALHELEGPGAQDRAENGIDACETPTLRKMAIDEGIERP